MSVPKPKIIIFSDSRGRGLEEFINQHPEAANYDNIINVLPGRDLNQIAVSVIQTIASLTTQDFYCIIFAGICGLTEQAYIEGTRRIHYPLNTRTNKPENAISTINDLKQRYGNKINFCTIIPASLQKYFVHHNPDKPIPQGLDDEQTALLEDTERINNHIIERSSSQNSNINLSKRFHRKSKKKRQKTATLAYRRVLKFSDKELPDGVHLSEEAKLMCFTFIYNSAIRDLQLQLQPPTSADETSKDTSQDDTDTDTDWDFKRRHTIDGRSVICDP